MKKKENGIKAAISVLLAIALVVTAVPAVSTAKAKVKLNKTKAVLSVGKTVTLKLKNNRKKVKWTSSNKKVATVTAKGKVKARKKGKATITAKAGKKKYRCRVTVKAGKKTRPTARPNAAPTSVPTATPIPTPTPRVPLKSFSLDKTEVTLEYGKGGVDITILPDPANATELSGITWERSNPDLIYLDETQNPLQIHIWAKSYVAGTTTVTARIGDLTASCEVTVPDTEAEFELSEDGTVLLDCLNELGATAIHIPDTVTTLGEDSLHGCWYVKSLEIPSNVTRIEDKALPSYLESVYIPPSVTYIGDQSIQQGCIIYGEAGSYAEQWVGESIWYTFTPR